VSPPDHYLAVSESIFQRPAPAPFRIAGCRSGAARAEAALAERPLARRNPGQRLVGVDLSYLRSLVDYWRDAYDGRGHEAALNALPQF
jgi:microsomal epoxide hydrolase